MHNILTDLETKIESDDVFGMIIADAEFHRQISRLSQNQTIARTMDTVLRILFEEWRSVFIVPISRIKNFIEHERILVAIEKHHPDEAKDAMRIHLEKALNRHIISD
jgi:DNA-binding GntR family transcriptional regulator